MHIAAASLRIGALHCLGWRPRRAAVGFSAQRSAFQPSNTSLLLHRPSLAAHLRCPQGVQVADVKCGVLQPAGRQAGPLLTVGRVAWSGGLGDYSEAVETKTECSMHHAAWLPHSMQTGQVNLAAALAVHGGEGACCLPVQAAVW